MSLLPEPDWFSGDDKYRHRCIEEEEKWIDCPIHSDTDCYATKCEGCGEIKYRDCEGETEDNRTAEDFVLLVFEKVNKADANRPRSKQTELGVSSLGSCRRAVWHKLRGDVGLNSTLKLPAIVGTAIHSMIENALTEYGQDLDVEIEKSVKVDGLPKGTIDLWIPSIGAVVDWKTTTKKNIPYFPSKHQLWQVQTYGYLLAQLGHTVRTVSLVAIPRDGDERDIVVRTFPYDENIALNAIYWLKEVEQYGDEMPEPEKPAKTWCKSYCSYFGSHCHGKN